eukprot:144829_1
MTNICYQKQQANLLLFGWVNENQNIISTKIPVSLVELMFEFFYINFPPFKWDTIKYGRGLTFTSDATVKEMMGTNGICVGNHVISSNVYSMFEWEIRIDECEKGQIFMGLVHTPIRETVTNWDTHLGIFNSSEQYYVLIDTFYQKKFFKWKDAGQSAHCHKKGTSNYIWKKGDRFKIRIDFKQKHASLYYNDEFISIVFTNIAEEVLPALALYHFCQVTCIGCYAE